MTLWLVGGLDPTGGAGISRDVSTARIVAPTLSYVTVATAHTLQGHGAPARARPIEASVIRDALAQLPSPVAVKVGLVPDPCVATVVDAIASLRVPIVVDPVMRASDGGDLGASPSGVLPLARAATLLTPNLAEADALLQALARDVEPGARACALVDALGIAAVLVKGGHDRDPETVRDVLCRHGRAEAFVRRRVPGSDPRGTGCALATAIACALARGVELAHAAAQAIAWLDHQRTRARPGPDGRLHLPDDGLPLAADV
jgi:hydroxymethylpyrimidine kinase/phosphomethylpyrimidine kinase